MKKVWVVKMISIEDYWEEALKEAKAYNERYIEVPDPDNIGETILVHQGFEEFLDYESGRSG